MERLKQGVIFSIIAICSFGCGNKEEVVLQSKFEYKVDGKMKQHNVEGRIYDDNTIELDGHIINLLIEDNLEQEYILNQNSYSQADYYPVNYEKQYSANKKEKDLGTISITNFDAQNLRVSGKFSYEAHDISDNVKVNITSGVFENIKLEWVQGYFEDGKIEVVADDVPMKYRKIWVTEGTDTTISAWVRHPNRTMMNIYIPKFDVGEYQITEYDTNSDNRDEVVFHFHRIGFNTPILAYPIGDCILEIQEANYDGNTFKGIINGKFATGITTNIYSDTIHINNLRMDLNWN